MTRAHRSARRRLRAHRARATRPAGAATCTGSSTAPASLRTAKRAPGVPRLGNGARRERGQDPPRRVRRVADHAVGVGRAEPDRPVSPGLVARSVRDRDRADRRRRSCRREPRARLPVRQASRRADGSFPQNSTVTGKPFWTGLQLDEVADPILLAYQLHRFDAAATRMCKQAADFLVGFTQDGNAAPWTPQERWENQDGYSPATIASEIAGLVCAAKIARANGDPASAHRYLAHRRRVARAREVLDGRPRTGRTRPSRTSCG